MIIETRRFNSVGVNAEKKEGRKEGKKGEGR